MKSLVEIKKSVKEITLDGGEEKISISGFRFRA